MVHCHKFRAFCWSEYSVVWSYSGGQGHTRVAHWDDSLVNMQTIIVSFRFSTTIKLLQVVVYTELQRTVHLDGAALPYGIAP